MFASWISFKATIYEFQENIQYFLDERQEHKLLSLSNFYFLGSIIFDSLIESIVHLCIFFQRVYNVERGKWATEYLYMLAIRVSAKIDYKWVLTNTNMLPQ